jgi:hypothetical protein
MQMALRTVVNRTIFPTAKVDQDIGGVMKGRRDTRRDLFGTACCQVLHLVLS